MNWNLTRTFEFPNLKFYLSIRLLKRTYILKLKLGKLYFLFYFKAIEEKKKH